MNIVQEVKDLGLPSGKYAVVGSGPLAVRKLRAARDIDLIVTQDIYDALRAKGWREENFPEKPGRPWVLFHGPFDVSTTWSVNDYEPSPEQLMRNADLIDGVPFVRLKDVLQWKRTCRREKDLHDVALIEAHLKLKGQSEND